MDDNLIVMCLEDALRRMKGADNLIVPKEGVENLCCGLEAAISLINRQKAEIEGLNADYTRACAERDARICTNNFIRAEAIKEFAERLKAIFDQHGVEYTAYAIVDDVAKEMGCDPDD